MDKTNHEHTVKATRDGEGIDAAVRRGVAKALEVRRKLGLPIVRSDRPTDGRSYPRPR